MTGLTPDDLRRVWARELRNAHNQRVLHMREGRIYGAASRLAQVEGKVAMLELRDNCNHMDYEIAHNQEARIRKLENLATRIQSGRV